MIGLLGATGHTGVFLARALRDLGRPILLGGRSRDKVSALAEQVGAEFVVCDAMDADSLVPLFERCDVVCNLAGPYTRLGVEACRVALQTRTHLFDLTGEQAFQRRCIDEWHEPARQAGIAIANAMGLEVVVSDVLAAILLERHPTARRVEVINNVVGFASSPGSRHSMLEIVQAPGFGWAAGRLQPGRRLGDTMRAAHTSWGRSHMVWSPAVDILTIARQGIPLQSVDVWFDCPRPVAWAIRAASRGLASGGRARPLVALFDKPFRPEAQDPWNVRVEVFSDRLLGALESYCPCRYRTTARITAWCLAEVVDRGLVSGDGGVLPPTGVIDAGRFLDAFEHELRLVDG